MNGWKRISTGNGDVLFGKKIGGKGSGNDITGVRAGYNSLT